MPSPILVAATLFAAFTLAPVNVGGGDVPRSFTGIHEAENRHEGGHDAHARREQPSNGSRDLHVEAGSHDRVALAGCDEGVVATGILAFLLLTSATGGIAIGILRDRKSHHVERAFVLLCFAGCVGGLSVAALIGDHICGR